MEVVLVLLLACTFLRCTEASSQCFKTEFKCSNGVCTHIFNLCDGSNDCGDLSDEKVCDLHHCHPLAFQCLNGKCMRRRIFCNKYNDCGDNSDEQYCNVAYSARCPPGWSRCLGGSSRCIPSHWVCDGIKDCNGNVSEETVRTVQRKLQITLLLKRNIKRGNYRLHCCESTFGPGNSTGEEIRYELTIQLLHHLAKDKKISSHELALYIHALLVACMDPRDFHGDDLVRELRRRVEASGNYTNPFLILALCNAGDTMTAKDVERVTTAYDSQHRPFWTDSQALSSMALSCISSKNDVSVDERLVKDMLQELKRHQFRNGTIDNFRSTALVSQVLFSHDAYLKEFDLDSAMKVLEDGLKDSISLLDAYYALPVFHRKSLLNVTSGHCRKEPVREEEALQKALDITGETMTVLYSVWMGDEINLGRIWRMKIRVNSTIYDVIEAVAKIDNRQKVDYNVVDGKPYVAALNGKDDDPEMGTYWFVYLKNSNSDKDPKSVEESPVDIKLKPNQEIILWYKRGPWNGQCLVQKSITSP